MENIFNNAENYVLMDIKAEHFDAGKNPGRRQFEYVSVHLSDEDGNVLIEWSQRSDEIRDHRNPDLIIPKGDIPRLIKALEWLQAGKLGRMAIEKEQTE